MVYHDIQTVFVQITKTASSSVHSLLGNERELSLPLLHLRYNKAVSDELINGLDVSNYYNFSTVRNPYDRYVSSYFFMKKIYNWNRDFDENLDELLNKPQNWWDNTFILLRPQWWFVCNHDTYEIEVDEVGPSLRNASAKVTKAARTSDGGRASASAATGGMSDDPWAASSTDSWGASVGASDEPPF
jgi:hypothetical protein